MGTDLVICIGNAARGDDGVAHEVARLLADTAVADVLSAVSLDVTHAPALASAARLVIVDAHRRSRPPVEVSRIEGGGMAAGTHGLTPEALVGLASGLYGGAPRAWLVSVAAPKMDHGEGLSRTATDAAVEAADAVRDLLTGRP